MKQYTVGLLFVFIVLQSLLYASDSTNISSQKVKIGVLNPEVYSAGKPVLQESIDALTKSLSDIGGYEIVNQSTIEVQFRKLSQRLPEFCREPRCVSAIGATIKADRMLYGIVDKSEKACGVSLVLVDVASKQIIEQVNIEGLSSLALPDVIRLAVRKLHGQTDKELDSLTQIYSGRMVNNGMQCLLTTTSCIGLGVIWAFVNSSLSEGNPVDANYINFMKGEAGIGTGADLIPLSGRPASLGNAYSAASDDAYGVFFNPAGLSWVSGPEGGICYQSRFGLNNFALSYVNKATREIGFGQGILYTGDDEKLFSEVYFISALSYRIANPFKILRPFSAGISLKIMSKRTGKGVSPSSVGGGAEGAGINVGTQLELSEKIRGAIVFNNLFSTLRWNNKSTNKQYYENEPIYCIVGGTYKSSYETMLVCDVNIPLYSEQMWRYHGGIEQLLFRYLACRIGGETTEGLNAPWKLNAGIGIMIPMESSLAKNIALDASYEYNTIQPFSNVLNFSIRYGF